MLNVTFLLGAKPCAEPQGHKGKRGRHPCCRDCLLLSFFLPFIHSSDLLSDYYVPCSHLGCWECKRINGSLLKDKQINCSTLTFVLSLRSLARSVSPQMYYVTRKTPKKGPHSLSSECTVLLGGEKVQHLQKHTLLLKIFTI